MGDGYTTADREQHLEDMTRLINQMFVEQTFVSFLPLFNIWSVYRPSVERGIGVQNTPKVRQAEGGLRFSKSSFFWVVMGIICITHLVVIEHTKHRAFFGAYCIPGRTTMLYCAAGRRIVLLWYVVYKCVAPESIALKHNRLLSGAALLRKMQICGSGLSIDELKKQTTTYVPYFRSL